MTRCAKFSPRRRMVSYGRTCPGFERGLCVIGVLAILIGLAGHSSPQGIRIR